MLRHWVWGMVVLMGLAGPGGLVVAAALPVVAQEVADAKAEAERLFELGEAQYQRSEFQAALGSWEGALALYRQMGDRQGEGRSLNNIGKVYSAQGNYSKALDFHSQALAIAEQIGDQQGKGRSLSEFGWVYYHLGDYSKALESYQQALIVIRASQDLQGEIYALNRVGMVYSDLGDENKALEYYQQSLDNNRNSVNLVERGISFNEIGNIYHKQGDYQASLDYYQQSLTIFKEIGNRQGEGIALFNIGNIYRKLGTRSQALTFLQQSLAVLKEIGLRLGEATVLSGIGSFFTEQQPGLAISFYKQAVNIHESIRKDLLPLSGELQQSYTETVADTYRNLADLLLKQDRVLEAQRVLDLLKVQELEDYLQDVRGNAQTEQGIELLAIEQQIVDRYTALQQPILTISAELTPLRRIPATDRTPAQQQRITQLSQQETAALAQLTAFLDSPEVAALTTQLHRAAASQSLNLVTNQDLQDTLQKVPNSVLLYPLILDDRLELVLTRPGVPPTRYTVNVKREELNKTILDFRVALISQDLNTTQTLGQQLYTWLIKPLETDLKQSQTQTIIYAPDGQLRYIPLAALYDGQKWLIETYRINNITAISLTNFAPQPPKQPQILAGAFVNGNYGNWTGLPFAGVEVASIANTFTNTTQLLDRAFSPTATLPKMRDSNIVHLATHAKFEGGYPDASFILFGDGTQVTLPQLKEWPLQNVDLVVMSACETARSGIAGNGEEVLGLGYQIQRAGAKAVIATLWAVDDQGTSQLMQAFYQQLKQGKTRAEALQAAQLQLIHSNYQDGHPYYWSPFILIGNGW